MAFNFRIRQRIEDAVIQTVKGAVPYLKNKVAVYNGEIDQTDGPDDMRRALRGRSPMVLVAATGATVESQNIQKRRFTRVLTLELYLLSCHLRSREDRLRKDVSADGDETADPGIYRIAEDLAEILSGRDLDVDGAGPFMPSREDVLLQMEDFTAWRVTYVIRTDAHAPAIGESGDEFTSYEINHNLVDDDGATVLPGPFNPVVEGDGSL